MKRFLTVILSLLLAISCSLVTFATEEKMLTNEELYACYQEIIEKTNEKYGYSLSLVSFEEMNIFYSVTEFQNMVEGYCKYKSDKQTITSLQAAIQTGARGNKVVTVPHPVTVSHNLDTVTVTFYGTFTILQNLQGSHYVDSESYTVFTSSKNGIITYEATGSPVVELYDHGRSHYVTQNFRVLLYGSFQDTDTVRAGYYISPATGNVTLLSI